MKIIILGGSIGGLCGAISLNYRVHQTANPFVQVILDLAVPKMYFSRVAILGDAAFLVRPHTASGTAKAYRDAIALASSLVGNSDLEIALQHWNDHQIRHAAALTAMVSN
jgi:2-polyprenyl-6-methoxyphenol hydroxylase-like FAD-dependent oxidoreductase